MKHHTIEVDVIKKSDSGIYVLKVSVLDLGVYIMGFTGRKSKRPGEDLWIQPPARNIAGKYRVNPSFNKDLDLWKEVEASCIEAVKDYEIGDSYNDSEDVDKMLSEAIDNI